MNIFKQSAIGLALFCILGISQSIQAQTLLGGQVHGNFQTDAQYYQKDSLIGANEFPEKMGMNAFLNMIYTNNNFEAGMRYEAYLPPLQGFDNNYKGSGIANRYIKYSKNDFEFTGGNFYEQFGSGMVLRAYEEWNLGFDNSIDGFRAKYRNKFLNVTGLVGKQRIFWDQSQGIIRGFDAELSVNDLIKPLGDKKTRVRLGGSFVSRYQLDEDPLYVLPENVGIYAGRINVYRGGFSASAELGHKINDPNASNGNIYKNGNAALVQIAYSKKGLGFNLQGKRTDNMDFRSDRSASGFNLPVNYLPSVSKQHAYTLAAMYPNSSQSNGEMGLQGTVFYKIKKGSKLGGKYGTYVALNASIIHGIDQTALNDSTSVGQRGTDGYNSDFFKVGEDKYYQDINIKISKKINKKWKVDLMYMNLIYNTLINEGHIEPDIKADIVIADVWWKLKKSTALHIEGQALFTEEDDGNWAMGMVEYKKKNFFAAVIDMYNYGNEDPDRRFHYFSLSTGYTHHSTRVSMTYGKQRQGILCVGGVCREVPASNGISLTIASSF